MRNKAWNNNRRCFLWLAVHHLSMTGQLVTSICSLSFKKYIGNSQRRKRCCQSLRRAAFMYRFSKSPKFYVGDVAIDDQKRREGNKTESSIDRKMKLKWSVFDSVNWSALLSKSIKYFFILFIHPAQIDGKSHAFSRLYKQRHQQISRLSFTRIFGLMDCWQPTGDWLWSQV